MQWRLACAAAHPGLETAILAQSAAPLDAATAHKK